MKPTIPEVIDRFRAYYVKEPVWGSLHMVLDEPNDLDYHVQCCLNDAQRLGDTEGAELAQILLQMSKTQRRKLRAVAWQAPREAR